MNLYQKLLNRIFGIHFVVLIDCDGELTISRCLMSGQRLMAFRYGRIVFLNDDMTVTGTFVKHWEPITWDQTK